MGYMKFSGADVINAERVIKGMDMATKGIGIVGGLAVAANDDDGEIGAIAKGVLAGGALYAGTSIAGGIYAGRKLGLAGSLAVENIIAEKMAKRGIG